MQSFASRFMPFIIGLRGSKKRYSSAELTLARVEALRISPKSFEPPHSISRIVDVRRREIGGWPVFELTPRASETPGRRALYLHGGSYVYEISSQHWHLAAHLAMEADARVVVPIYPLAPRGTAGPVVEACADLAETLIAEVGGDAVTLAGDSAGGGLALAVALVLRDRSRDEHADAHPVSVPPRVVLISPVLDLSLTDPRVAELAVRDPWLAIPGSRVTGDLYRGDLPIDDPRVSPIHGDLAGLGPIVLYSGTRDMLNADAGRLVALAATAGHPLEYHEVPEMIHVYPLLPIPEAAAARRSIVAFMTRPALHQ